MVVSRNRCNFTIKNGKTMGKKEEYKYSYKELAEIASRYNDNSEFRKMEKSAYNQMSKRGLIKELCACVIRPIPVHFPGAIQSPDEA